MSIHRGGLVIPNPREHRPILSGDVLLCYGLKDALRNLLPALNAKKKPNRKIGKLSQPDPSDEIAAVDADAKETK